MLLYIINVYAMCVCVYSVCIYTCAPHVYLVCEEKLVLLMVVSSELGTLKKQQVILTAKPSLQSSYSILVNCSLLFYIGLL